MTDDYQFLDKMPDRLKVEDTNHLYRDSKSNGIINTDTQAYQNYLRSKQINQRKDNRIESLENDVNSLKSDLKDIKSLLQEIAKNAK